METTSVPSSSGASIEVRRSGSTLSRSSGFGSSAAASSSAGSRPDRPSGLVFFLSDQKELDRHQDGQIPEPLSANLGDLDPARSGPE